MAISTLDQTETIFFFGEKISNSIFFVTEPLYFMMFPIFFDVNRNYPEVRCIAV